MLSERQKDSDRDFAIKLCALLPYRNLKHILCKMWVGLVYC